jgi:nicotinate dehydrogenase subunit B
MTAPLRPSRRHVLVGTGSLLVSFSLPALAQEGQNAGVQPAPAPLLPGSLKTSPMLDAWIRVDADGRVTVFTGKAELGQGIRTAVLQVAAEELSIEPDTIELVTADTGRTPNEGFTSGSQSMQDSATAIRHAAAQVREILVATAAGRLNLPAEQLQAQRGAVLAPDGRRLGYSELVSDQLLQVRAQPTSKLKDPASYAVIGQSLPRVDIPGKLTGAVSYVHDLRLPNMAHARVVRPPGYGARLRAVDTSAVERMPGVLKVVRDGNYLAVIAEREYQAVKAWQALGEAATWDPQPNLPEQSQIFAVLQRLPASDRTILDRRGPEPNAAKVLEAGYQRPYQMHGSIGPSCAVGQLDNDMLTVWSHAQGMFPLQKSIAEMLRMPVERVRCIHMEGAGCYGHNGADDAGADAALLARALPGRPVRVQWMREDEHMWEPFGSGMVVKAKAALDADGRIVDWQYEVWSCPHSTRPEGAGNLMPAWHLATPFAPPEPKPIPQPSGGGDRNAIPLYAVPRARVVHHFIPSMPVRTSALRALGGYMNVFATESFMDELAQAAGADPVEFRLRHIEDKRARDVIATAAERFRWSTRERMPKGRGRGFGFARYKNLAAYTAVAVEVEVAHETGRVRLVRAVAANDCGEIVNPDGVRNQIEGAIVQSASWTLHEAVTFGKAQITSRDWSSYPILRFRDVPERVEVHLIDRPGEPFLGTGESGQGPAAAAIANAVANATGARIRTLPLTADRVKAAIGV